MSPPYEIAVFFVADAVRRGAPAASNVAAEVALIDLLARSAAQKDGATVTVLSDQATDLSGLTAPANIVRYDLSGMPLMLGRLTAEARYTQERDFGLPLVLADTDILINRPIASVFADDFDIGVTVRRKPDMPINSGIRLLSNRRPEESRRFMRELAELVAGRFLGEANWWADQMALNAMLPVDPGMTLPATFRHNGYVARALSVAEYNYSPPPYALAMLLPYRTRAVLHFKSARRKRLMPVFFRRHFASV